MLVFGMVYERGGGLMNHHPPFEREDEEKDLDEIESLSLLVDG